MGIPLMATIYDLIRDTEEELRVARRDAKFCRDDLRDNPNDRKLRIELDNAEHHASEIGRKIAEYEFTARIDEWIDGVMWSRIVPDELLLRLAPRDSRGLDDEWLAAAHLLRQGVKVPKGWRSSTGETVNDHTFNQSDPGRAA
jgi:hypothetical protein